MLDKLMQHGIGAGGGSNIKSIQKGIAAFSSAQTELIVPINKITIANSIIIIKQFPTSQPTRYEAVGGKLGTDGLSLILKKNISGIASNCHWIVIEFNNVKSIQSGESLSSTNAYREITIAEVDISKSFSVESFTTSLGSESSHEWLNVTSITSSTKLGIYSRTGSTVYWQVVEFK